MDLPVFDPYCEKERVKCTCWQTAQTGKRLGKLVINPVNKRHADMCLISVTACAVAWTSIAAPKVVPVAEKISAPLSAECISINNKLEEYERSMGVLLRIILIQFYFRLSESNADNLK